jgi:Tfp pilus assembly protein PilN
MDAVNLLPIEYRTRKRRRTVVGEGLNGRRTMRTGGIVALVFALLLGGLYVRERSVVHDKQSKLASTQAQIASVQAKVDALKAAQSEVSARLAAAQTITGSRMNWDRALGDFARIVPTNSYLTSLTVNAPSPAAAASTVTATDTTATTTDTTTTTTPAAPTTSTLTVGGVAPGTTGVALVMDRLALLPWLSNVALQSAARQENGSDTFTIGASVSEAH